MLENDFPRIAKPTQHRDIVQHPQKTELTMLKDEIQNLRAQNTQILNILVKVVTANTDLANDTGMMTELNAIMKPHSESESKIKLLEHNFEALKSSWLKKDATIIRYRAEFKRLKQASVNSQDPTKEKVTVELMSSMFEEEISDAEFDSDHEEAAEGADGDKTLHEGSTHSSH